MPQILDVEQALLLLELEAPFAQRDVQLARRRMAKRWHPDIAPPSRRHEHQRHLQAINEAADQLEQLAETSRGGRVSRNAVKVSAAAARKAHESGVWRDLPPSERAKALWRAGDLIEERAQEFAELDSLDNGKPINEMLLFDVPLSAATFRYYAGWVTKLDGGTQQTSFPGQYLSYTLRQPVGVVGQIIPWNFPLLMLAWKWGPALACGNTVVLKPAEQTPLTALRVAALAQEAGFPDGVVNVVPGFGPTAGAALSGHMDVDKVAFTGEGRTGQLIMEAAARSNLKRVSLELGGKSPNVVFADADLADAIPSSVWSIYYSAGQSCEARSRILVEAPLYDDFVASFSEAAGKLKLGDPLEQETQVGSLISPEHRDKVHGYVETGREEGAEVVTGGEAPDGESHTPDYLQFMAPEELASLHSALRAFHELRRRAERLSLRALAYAVLMEAGVLQRLLELAMPEAERMEGLADLRATLAGFAELGLTFSWLTTFLTPSVSLAMRSASLFAWAVSTVPRKVTSPLTTSTLIFRSGVFEFPISLATPRSHPVSNGIPENLGGCISQKRGAADRLAGSGIGRRLVLVIFPALVPGHRPLARFLALAAHGRYRAHSIYCAIDFGYAYAGYHSRYPIAKTA